MEFVPVDCSIYLFHCLASLILEVDKAFSAYFSAVSVAHSSEASDVPSIFYALWEAQYLYLFLLNCSPVHGHVRYFTSIQEQVHSWILRTMLVLFINGLRDVNLFYILIFSCDQENLLDLIPCCSICPFKRN